MVYGKHNPDIDPNRTLTLTLTLTSAGVEMLYDTKKKYCPKYEFHFYMLVPALQSFFSVYMPMLAATLFSFINATQSIEDTSLVDNAIARCPSNTLSSALSARHPEFCLCPSSNLNPAVLESVACMAQCSRYSTDGCLVLLGLTMVLG
jgi:hypothetical protein